MPRISIVTPSYQQARYIDAAIRSVLDQQYPDLEYIVMDGGSRDGSVDVIREHEDELAYWRSRKDDGQAAAIAEGFSRASGDVLGWLNSDDLLLPGALWAVARFFRKHPDVECAVGGSVLINADGNMVPCGRLALPEFNLGTRITYRRLLLYSCGGFNQPASFWTRRAYNEVGGFDKGLRFCLDYDLYLRLAKRRSFGRIPQFLAAFRIHPESKTSTMQDVRSEESEILWRRFGRYRYSESYRKLHKILYKTSDALRNHWQRILMASGILPMPVIPEVTSGLQNADRICSRESAGTLTSH